MNKQEFLDILRSRLSSLDPADIEKTVDFYSEMIDDRIEDGMSEEQAVETLGSIDEIVSQVMLEVPLPKLAKAAIRPSRTLRAWEIVLLILGSPVWLPLLLAFAIILLSVYIVIWSVVLVLYSADLSIAAGAVAGISAAVILLGRSLAVQAAFFLGAALICAGIAILLFFAFNKVTMGIVYLSRMLIRSIKRSFIRKGDAV